MLTSKCAKVVIKLICVLVVIILTQSCGSSPTEPTDEINGEYIFKYPSGHIEILNIKNSPRTYTQTFYLNDSDCINKKPALYENKGTWIAIGPELEFDHWLSICELGRFPVIMTEPSHVHMLNVYWEKATANKKAAIIIAFEEGYILRKKL